MKVSIIGLLFLVPVLTLAQDGLPWSSEGGDMQEMMEKLQQVQSCMANIDPTKLQQLEQRSKALQSKIVGLCAAGKRKQAQSAALKLATELVQDRTMSRLKRCAEEITEELPGSFLQALEERLNNQQVCGD